MSAQFCPWVPFRRELMRVAHENRMAFDSSLEYCRDRVRPLHKELKAKGHRVTLKDLSSNLQSAVRWLKFLRDARAERKELAPNYNLEERIIRRFYAPYKEDIRVATSARNGKPTITIKRGEPAVKYYKKVHGYGYGRWEEACLDITLPPGWPKLAAEGKHIIHNCTGMQERSLIVEWTPETPADDLFGPQHQFRAGLARIVQRGVGTKTLSEPIIMAEHAGVWVSDNCRMDWALKKLPIEVAKRVSSKLN